jgi:hypothetical protein
VVDESLKAKLLGQLAELEAVTASLRLTVRGSTEGLDEGQVAELLAAVGPALARLRALRNRLPPGGSPGPSPGGADAP